jgi:hypothetical protein
MAGPTVVISTKTGLNGIPVTPAATYSVLCYAKASVASLQLQTNILWFKSDGTASTTPRTSGTLTALVTTAFTAVLLNAATSPADAAFAAVEIVWQHTTTTTVGMYVNVDNIVFSRSTQAAWGPGSGSTNIKFVIEHSFDGGVSWEPVWGQNYDNPVPSRSPSDIRVVIRDRAVQLNKVDALYRCYAIGVDANGLPVYSLPTVTPVAPPVTATTGFLRMPEDDYYDGTLQVDSYTRTYAMGGQSFAPQGAIYGVVQYDTAPQVETIEYTVWCIDGNATNRLINLLQMKRTLCIQLATNSVRYIRPIGDFSLTPVRAAPRIDEVAAVRTVNKCTFRAVSLQPPTYVSKLVTL